MTEFVEVKLGAHAVQVPKGGYFDRFRMQPDLDEVARDPQVSTVEYFRSLTKRMMDSPLGETANPTFYYRASVLQLTMLAPLDAVRDRLPEPLEPLALMPGVGMVTVVVFNYAVSDIDPYREAAVSIAVRPPRHGGSPEVDVASALANGALHAYTLSLPVTTEIARVRGLYNYGLPKWVTDVDLDVDRRVTARIGNDDGGTDIAVDLPLPPIENYPLRFQRDHGDLADPAQRILGREPQPNQRPVRRQRGVASRCRVDPGIRTGERRSAIVAHSADPRGQSGARGPIVAVHAIFHLDAAQPENALTGFRRDQPLEKEGRGAMTNQIVKVAVLGAGVLGSQIAFQIAFSGFDVTAYDIDDRALAAARDRLARLAAVYRDEVADAGSGRAEKTAAAVTLSSDFGRAVQDADLVIEVGPEDLALKQDIFKRLGDAAPERAIFATNSSTLLPSDMKDFTGRPDKFLAMHFANEIWKRNTAEIMGTPQTDPEVYRTVVDFAAAIGMVPIELHKEKSGYVLNSMLVPFLDSALELAVDGYAEPQTIDRTWRIGMGVPQGPFQVLDIIGLNTAYNILSHGNENQRRLGAWLKDNYVDKGKLGVAAGEGFYPYSAEK